jgi:SAM-dependent methyltransferase
VSRPAFPDHFSRHASHYADARPTYPPALFEWLATLTERHDCAWDVGTGNGQAARDLARFYRRVMATDASQQQIAAAQPAPNVEYRVAAAEDSGLADQSIDLVTVAQALHWFDLKRFWPEVRRVCRPRAAFVAWAYGYVRVEPRIDAVVMDFYENVVGPYWPPERSAVEEGYTSIVIPFTPIALPAGMELAVEWSVGALRAYIESWSATQRFIAARGRQAVHEFGARLEQAWGDVPERRVSWTLSIRAARVCGDLECTSDDG